MALDAPPSESITPAESFVSDSTATMVLAKTKPCALVKLSLVSRLSFPEHSSLQLPV